MQIGHVSVKGLRRVDLARATGCNLETIRYYENIGVMPDPPRNANGYRCYDAGHVARLKFVMRARDLGFTLGGDGEWLARVGRGVETWAEVRKLAQGQVDNVRQKIADLTRIERVLSETLAKCSGERVPECAVIDALSQE